MKRVRMEQPEQQSKKLVKARIGVIRLVIRKPTLARMLMLIMQEPGITTTDLLYRMRLTGYGLRVLKQAAKEGYVNRVPQQDDGRGNPKIRNYLTSQGKEVAEFYQEIEI